MAPKTQTKQILEPRPRFIFRGNAAAFGGRIIRPKDVILESPGASCLTVSGGRSAARVPKTAFEDFSVDSASTLAEGFFDDAAKYRDSTLGKMQRDELTAVTHVSAEVLGVTAGKKPQLTVKRMIVSLTAQSPRGGNEPSIAVNRETRIDGVSIAGFNLIVELQTALFRRYDTRSKLVTAASDATFVQEFGDALFMRAAVGGTAPPSTGRLREASGTINATIVKSIRWENKPFAGAVIDNNVVYVPDFGRLYFGELLVSGASRRLTMLRMEFGSPMGGDASCADVQDNGGWGI